ncbi:NAD(P)-binding protein [Hypomontagnella submonticulosa]|nr:NAD(P)-binding protein [Hypomontagnella submonticulosa]
MGSQWSQFFPPKPEFTEADVADQEGKVFLITGGYSGIGFQLAKVLYRKKARVYIAGRSEEKARQAIKDIQDAEGPGGSLEYLHLDLADLSSIKASADAFKAKELKLDVLWNNAGVSQPPVGSVSKQGIELQLATNCLGPFLFTQLLRPVLEAAAAGNSNPGSVRVVWTASQVIELSSPPEGIIMSEVREPPKDKSRNYTNSKTGNLFLSSEFARRIGSSHSIISVAHNPGATSTNLFRHVPLLKYLAWPLMHKVELAALTPLYAGLSGDITMEKNGCYVLPWGRISQGLKASLGDAMRTEEDGGTGRASEFWEFCEEKTQPYA